jgi:hypothetical protein
VAREQSSAFPRSSLQAASPAFEHANLVAVVRAGLQVLGRRDQLMAKRKGKDLSAPAKNPKYEGCNNTKKMAKKKG